MISSAKILVYGYGNPGRQDDGLGAVLIDMLDDWLEENQMKNIETDCNYQLNIEDAASISDKELVIFVDASQEEIDHFSFTKIEASDAKVEFSMHAVSPSFVLDLCNKIYNKNPEAYLLHIAGYEWDFKEVLTENAKQNLKLAFEYLTQYLRKNELAIFAEAVTK